MPAPHLKRSCKAAGIEPELRQEIIERVMQEGTCQGVQEVPAEIRDVFVTSNDITAEEHVRMQAAMQAFVDNSLSKTVNFPPGATEEDVATAYMLAWELGCKGITVYVTGSREKVVLETRATPRRSSRSRRSRTDHAGQRGKGRTDRHLARDQETPPALAARLHLLGGDPAGQGLSSPSTRTAAASPSRCLSIPPRPAPRRRRCPKRSDA
jgi:ribonucleotide reductase alpha subunit